MFASLARFSCCGPIVDTLQPREPLPLVFGGAQLPAWYVLSDAEWGHLGVTRALYGLVVDAHVRARELTGDDVAEAWFLDEKLPTGDGLLSLFQVARKLAADGQDDAETIAALLAPVYAATLGQTVQFAHDRLKAVGVGLQAPEKMNLLCRHFKNAGRVCFLLDEHPEVLVQCEEDLRRLLEQHGRTAAERRPILPWFLAYRLLPVEPIKPYVRQPYLRKNELELERRWTGIEYQGLVGYMLETVYRTIERVREFEDRNVELGMAYFVTREALALLRQLEGKPPRKSRGSGEPPSNGEAGSSGGQSGSRPPKDCSRRFEFAMLARAGQDALPPDFAAHLGACPACLGAFVVATMPADEASELLQAAGADTEETFDACDGTIPPVAVSTKKASVVQARGAGGLDWARVSARQAVREWIASLLPGPAAWLAAGGVAVGAAGAWAMSTGPSNSDAASPEVGQEGDRLRVPNETWPKPEERNRPACGVVDPLVDYGTVASAIPGIVLDAPHESLSLSELEAVERIAAVAPGLTIVLGGAGTGKSIFAQHVAAASCATPSVYVSYLHPTALAAVTTRSLEEIVYEKDLAGGVISFDAFQRLLSRGPSLLLLDGFDELKVDESSALRDQVVRWHTQYPRASLVLFSKPMPDTGSTLGFAQQLVESRTYRIARLTVAHAHRVAERNRGIDPVRFEQFLEGAGVGLRDTTGEHYVYVQSFRAVGAMASLFLETRGERVTANRAFDALFTGAIPAVGEPEPKACLANLVRPLSRTTPIRIAVERCEAVAASYPDLCGEPERACRNLLGSDFFVHENGTYRPITPAFESFLAVRYGRAVAP